VKGRWRGGFTLLEVMVALAILAGALMALAELGGSALRNHAAARDLSAATLLARGKLAELEERYEDAGFKDGDEQATGDFADAGRPDVRWAIEVVRPDPSLAADQLLATLAGAGGTQGLLDRLFGGGAAAGTAPGKPQGTQPGPLAGAAAGLLGGGGAAGGLGGGALAGMVQTQVTAFGEQIKKAVRELRLTVAWNDGRPRSFTVTEHLVVLNPRAPGGARGDAPDVPPNLAAQAAVAGAAGAAGLPGTGLPGSRPGAAVPGVGGLPGTSTVPGTGGLPGSFPAPRRRGQ
jgi:general secretion pathway protein I